MHYLTVLLALHNPTDFSVVNSLQCALLNKTGIAMRHYDSGFTSFGRFLLLWLGVGANEAMIRNLSLILEDITESATKAMAAQENS